MFRDPEFDGEPVLIYEPDDANPVPPDPEPEDENDDDEANEDPGVYKVSVSGVSVKIIAERVEYLGPDGNLITATSPANRFKASSPHSTTSCNVGKVPTNTLAGRLQHRAG